MATSRRAGLWLLALLILGSCVSTGGGSGAQPAPAPSGKLTVPSALGTAGRTFVLRPSTVAGPRPLVLVLHGWGDTSADIERQSGATAFAAARGFTVAYPQGLQNAWNAGGCCAGVRSDDLQFLRDVVTEVSQLTAVDRQRVYLWGFSNGGMMAFRAMCQLSGEFAAIGVVAGVLWTGCPLPVRAYVLHGLADLGVPYRGGYSYFLNATVPASSTEGRRLPAGSVLKVHTVAGLHHVWPTVKNSGVDAVAELWAFVSQYSLG